jgi:hypothetical protein
MSWLLNVTWCCVEILQRTFSLEEKLRLLSDLMVIIEGGANGLQECITGLELYG